MLRLERDADLPLATGNFGAVLANNGVRVPAALAPVLDQLCISTAEQLARLAEEYPSAFVAVLGWSQDDLQNARAELVRLLSKESDPSALKPMKRPPVHLGALPPRLRRR